MIKGFGKKQNILNSVEPSLPCCRRSRIAMLVGGNLGALCLKGDNLSAGLVKIFGNKALAYC